MKIIDNNKNKYKQKIFCLNGANHYYFIEKLFRFEPEKRLNFIKRNKLFCTDYLNILRLVSFYVKKMLSILY